MTETKRKLLYLADISEWVREAPKRPPQRLSNFLRAAGGLKDQMGEITNLTGGRHYRGFGLVSMRGLPLDEAARLAWEAGYIATPERPIIADLIDALAQDLSGDHVYSAEDHELVEIYEAAENARLELDELGLLADTNSKQKRVEQALLTAAEALL